MTVFQASAGARGLGGGGCGQYLLPMIRVALTAACRAICSTLPEDQLVCRLIVGTDMPHRR